MLGAHREAQQGGCGKEGHTAHTPLTHGPREAAPLIFQSAPLRPALWGSLTLDHIWGLGPRQCPATQAQCDLWPLISCLWLGASLILEVSGLVSDASRRGGDEKACRLRSNLPRQCAAPPGWGWEERGPRDKDTLSQGYFAVTGVHDLLGPECEPDELAVGVRPSLCWCRDLLCWLKTT